MAKNVLLVIGLLVLGVLVFCLCCYKVTNLLYQLFSLDSQTEPDLLSSPIKDKTNQNLSELPNSFSFNQGTSGRIDGSREQLLSDQTTELLQQAGELDPVHRQRAGHSLRYAAFQSQEHLNDLKSLDYQDTTPRCSRHAALRLTDTKLQEAGTHIHEEVPMVNMNHFNSLPALRSVSEAVDRAPPPYPPPPPPLHYRSNGRIGEDITVKSSRIYGAPNPSTSYTNIHQTRFSHSVDSSTYPHCCSVNSGLYSQYPQTQRRNKTGYEMHTCQERFGEISDETTYASRRTPNFFVEGEEAESYISSPIQTSYKVHRPSSRTHSSNSVEEEVIPRERLT